MRLSRRDLLAAAAYLSAGAVSSRVASGGTLFAQTPRPTVAPGKEGLVVRSLRPPDYETPVALLDSWITPVENFYVRSHLPVPSALDAAAWTLQVEGEVDKPVSLSMDDIRKMPSTTITMTLECAGNGRSFFDPPVAGI